MAEHLYMAYDGPKEIREKIREEIKKMREKYG